MKKYIISALLLSACFSFSSAQVVGDIPTDQPVSSCTNLQNNLTYKKSKDSNTNGEVSELQLFLQDQGFLKSDPTGNFGALTFKGVKAFQSQQGLLSSGYVGPLTRRAISAVSCDTVSTGTTTRAVVAFARTSGFTDQIVSPNTPGVKIGSFTIMAGSENINVSSFEIALTGTAGNITNVTIKNDSLVLGTPIATPSFNLTSLVSFSPILVSANQTKTFDVYADIGNASTGFVSVLAYINFYSSNGIAQTLSADGVTTTSTTSTSASLANPTLSPTSPMSQFVIGGSTMGIATFRLATIGGQATVRELNFTTSGQDSITSIIVGGVTRSVVGNGVTTISGLNIPISSNGTDVPVVVKFNGFQNTTMGGALLSGVTNVGVTLTSVTVADNSGRNVTNKTQVSSNKMTLVASKPTVIMASGDGSSPLMLGAENKVGEFTVMADANGNIGVSQISLSLISSGINNVQYSSPTMRVNGSIISGVSNNISVVGSNIIANPASWQIARGSSNTFSVYATVAGLQTSNASAPSVSSKLNQESFLWKDLLGNNAQYTGSNIYNFPTNSYITNGNIIPVVNPVVVAPTVSITASVNSITQGQQAQIYWASTGATSCYANSVNGADLDWMGSSSFNGKTTGNISISPLTNSTYEIICSSSNGKNVSSKVTVNVTPAPVVATPTQPQIVLPTASFTIDGMHSLTMVSGETKTRTWSSSGGTAWSSAYTFSGSSCSQNGTTINGPVMTSSGSAAFYANPAYVGCSVTVKYSVSNTAGSVNDSVVVIITKAPVVVTPVATSTPITPATSTIPVLPVPLTPKITSLSVLSGVLKVGDTADINFSSQNTNYCHLYMTPPNSAEITLTEGYFSSKLMTTSPLVTPGNYRVVLYCWDKTGAADNQSTTFNVSPGSVLGAFASSLSCADIPRNLHRGAESNSVKNLQNFLAQKGLLKDTPSGFYGDKTVEAVKDYQASKGLPVTGMVYDFTRQAIKAETCR